MPDQFKDEEQIFEVGQHVDKVIHEHHGNYNSGNPIGYHEYAGEIIKVVNKNEGKLNSPRRWVIVLLGIIVNSIIRIVILSSGNFH